VARKREETPRRTNASDIQPIGTGGDAPSVGPSAERSSSGEPTATPAPAGIDAPSRPRRPSSRMVGIIAGAMVVLAVALALHRYRRLS
jgi:hypothetical protein